MKSKQVGTLDLTQFSRDLRKLVEIRNVANAASELDRLLRPRSPAKFTILANTILNTADGRYPRIVYEWMKPTYPEHSAKATTVYLQYRPLLCSDESSDVSSCIDASQGLLEAYILNAIASGLQLRTTFSQVSYGYLASIFRKQYIQRALHLNDPVEDVRALYVMCPDLEHHIWNGTTFAISARCANIACLLIRKSQVETVGLEESTTAWHMLGDVFLEACCHVIDVKNVADQHIRVRDLNRKSCPWYLLGMSIMCYGEGHNWNTSSRKFGISGSQLAICMNRESAKHESECKALGLRVQKQAKSPGRDWRSLKPGLLTFSRKLVDQWETLFEKCLTRTG